MYLSFQLQRKAEKKAEHDRVIKEGQEISAKKKQAKREAAKQKQAEDMRRKQDKIRVRIEEKRLNWKFTVNPNKNARFEPLY